MIDSLFLDHPRTVGETYAEHFRVATRFGATMVLAGLACMIHGLVPAWFTRTGSEAVKRLYGEMKHRQPRFRDAPPAYLDAHWQLEYEI